MDGMMKFTGMLDSQARKLEKFFLLFLFVNPFIDIVGGVFIHFFQRDLALNTMPITFSLVIRMIFLLVMGYYLLIKRYWRELGIIAACGAAAIASIICALLFSERYNTFTDYQYVARYMFNLLAMAVYAMALQRGGEVSRHEAAKKLEKAFSIAALAYALTILLSFITGLGLSTVGDRFGMRGMRAFFYSGNEITAVMTICLPVCIKRFLELDFKEYRKLKNLGILLTPGLCANALIIVGTKTSYLALILIFAFFTIYALIRLLKKSKDLILRFLSSCATVGVIFLALILLSRTGMLDAMESALGHIGEAYENYENIDEDAIGRLEETFVAESGLDVRKVMENPMNKVFNFLLSGRQYKLINAAIIWSEGPFPVYLFGTGRSAFLSTIEMDLFEVFFYYGIIGFVILVYPFTRRLFPLVKRIVKDFSMEGFAAALGIIITIGYSFLAGHVLFTVTAGFYLALMIVYVCLYYNVKVDLPSTKRN